MTFCRLLSPLSRLLVILAFLGYASPRSLAAYAMQEPAKVELPDTDLGTIPVHTISPRLSATPGRFRRAAPHLGEDTRDVLGEIGYTDSTIAGFISSGLVKMPDKPEKR